MSMSGLAKAAEFYVASGYRVFPCIPDEKKPLTPNGFHDASADLDVVAEWWRGCPDANIGLPMALNGLVAIDADTYKPGCGWDDFVAGKTVPDTWVQGTAREGRHFIFTAPSDHRFAGTLTTHVEIKSAGYIVAAPSRFRGQRYGRLTQFRPAPAPYWLLKAGAAAVASGDAGIMDADDLAYFLAGLDPRDYADNDSWFGLMCAAHQVTSGSGERAFAEWSAGDPAYADDTRTVRRRWRSLRQREGFGVGTLIKALRDGGRDDLADGMRLIADEAEDVAGQEFQADRGRLALTDAAAGVES